MLQYVTYAFILKNPSFTFYLFLKKRFYQLPFKRLMMTSEVECFHDPIFLAGRYLKYSRTLAQTTWLVEGERGIKINSIEEILSAVLLKEIGASGINRYAFWPKFNYIPRGKHNGRFWYRVVNQKF